MASIVSGILSLTQYLTSLETTPKLYYLECCPHPDCGKSGLWRHGFRFRKSDREHDEQSTMNPIPILRLYCPSCGHTCSLLPECIPPFRWYLWLIQQAAIKLYFDGLSFNNISQKIGPSRWTISRWLKRLGDQFNTQALHLKSKWSWLGYQSSLKEFWRALFDKMDLSYAMLFLNNQGVIVP